MQDKPDTRRSFLRKSALAASSVFAGLVPSSVPGRGAQVRPNNRINIGCIGVGPQGSGDMSNFLHQGDARVIAVCDVKANVLKEAVQKVNEHYHDNGCKGYRDFRELVARPDIDAVLIATTDHWHVLVGLEAARAGKDMYLEKPMGLSVAEDQALRAECRRLGTVFQFGTQQRSDYSFRLACELAVNEKIGRLRAINVWAPGSSSGGPVTQAPIPEWLDYDRWLGPAPFVPYTIDRESNKYWWFISDYALGFIAGWGVHPLDIALWGGGKALDGLVEVEGQGVFPESGVCDTALTWDVTYRYANEITMRYTGNPPPPEWPKRYGRTTDHGTAFEGSEGWVHVDRNGINASRPELLRTSFDPSDIRLIRSRNHVRNFLDSVRSRRPTICPIEDAVRADICCHLADIATRTRQKLVWDQHREKFVNNDGANRFLVRAMRSPWRL